MRRQTCTSLFLTAILIISASTEAAAQGWFHYKFIKNPHKKSISSVDCFAERTENGYRSYLVSGSQDGTAVVWDMESETPKHTLVVSEKQIWSLAVSPNGQRVAFGTDDSKVAVYDPWSGEHKKTLSGHTGRIWGVAWHPEGNHVVSCSDKGEVNYWNVESGEAVLNLSSDPNDKVISAIAISPDGKTIAFGSRRDNIYLYSVETGARIGLLEDLSEEPKTMSFSPDGQLLASSGGDTVITVRSTANWNIVKELGAHQRKVMAVRWSLDSQRLFSGSYDRRIIEWDVTGQRALNNMSIEKQYSNDIALFTTPGIEWMIASARPAGIDLFLPSLYRRLGRNEGIAVFVDVFIDKMIADETMNGNAAIRDVLQNTDPEKLKSQATKWFSQVSGGPAHYNGPTMQETYLEMNITDAEWQAMVANLRASMYGQRTREQNALLITIERIREKILNPDDK